MRSLEAAAETLQTNGVSGAPVVGDGKLEGVVTANDLVRSFTGVSPRGRHAWLSFLSNPTADFVRRRGTRVRDVMTRDVVAVTEETPLAEIAAILDARNITRVPVVGGGSLVGIVSRADILRAMVALSQSRAAGPLADDRTLRARILRMLSSETEVSTTSISVIVGDGVVYLWEVAETEDEKEAIRIAAERVAGRTMFATS